MTDSSTAETVTPAVVSRRIVLQQPLVCVDLETTGTNRKRDRIVRIGLLKLFPDGHQESLDLTINPGISIPPAATAVHGIGDADVASKPRFAEVASGIRDWVASADLTGFNIETFDLEILSREMQEAGQPLDLNEHAIVDVRRIDNRVRPRALADVYRDYFGEEMGEAHSPLADAQATVDLLHAQVARYPQLSVTVSELAAQLRDPARIDRRGKLVWQDGRPVFTFGMHEGKSLQEVVAEAPDYLDYMLTRDFDEDLKAIVRDAKAGRFPTPSENAR